MWANLEVQQLRDEVERLQTKNQRLRNELGEAELFLREAAQTWRDGHIYEKAADRARDAASER